MSGSFLGEIFREQRIHACLTRDECRLRSKLSLDTFKHVESGRHLPNEDTLARLLAVLSFSQEQEVVLTRCIEALRRYPSSLRRRVVEDFLLFVGVRRVFGKVGEVEADDYTGRNGHRRAGKGGDGSLDDMGD